MLGLVPITLCYPQLKEFARPSICVGAGESLGICLAFDNYLLSSGWLTPRGLSATVTILRRKPMRISTDFMNSAEYFAIG